MKRSNSMLIRRQPGFSLVEIMVGMAIGMIGVIIIMQVTSAFEARKESTISGDDAQNGGAIALYGMQKDVAQAGYGVSSPLLFGQSLSTPNVIIAPFAPVRINPPQLVAVGDPGTDTILVTYGNSNTPEGGAIRNPALTLPYRTDSGTRTGMIGTGGVGFAVGDWVIPAQSGVTGDPTAAAPALIPQAMYSVIAPPASGVVSVAGVAPALADPPNAPTHPILFNMGPAPVILAYAVIGGSLSVCDYMAVNCAATPGAWQQLAGNIITMRAFCEPGNGLRIALVNRSTRPDRNNVVTNAVPAWNPGGTAQDVVLTPGPSWGADWKSYHYKTFETVIPIRNATWTGAGGCI